jgi:hypothetical protein
VVLHPLASLLLGRCHRHRSIRELLLLTLFPVEHTSVLDRAVVEYRLVEVPSTGRSNSPGGRSNRLGQERHRKPKIAALGRTPSGTTHLGLF